LKVLLHKPRAGLLGSSSVEVYVRAIVGQKWWPTTITLEGYRFKLHLGVFSGVTNLDRTILFVVCLRVASSTECPDGLSSSPPFLWSGVHTFDRSGAACWSS
jgi:hypothetical protein